MRPVYAASTRPLPRTFHHNSGALTMRNQASDGGPENSLRPPTIAEITANFARYLRRQRETLALVPHEEVADLFPKMSEEEFRGLEEDIAANGQLDPITVHRGKVIDGL